MTVTVYGASDDLIEIEGDIREEFQWYGGEPAILGFSDGTLLSIQWGRTWRIDRIARGYNTKISVERADEDDDDKYTDRATIDADIKWVVFGTEYREQK